MQAAVRALRCAVPLTPSAVRALRCAVTLARNKPTKVCARPLLPSVSVPTLAAVTGEYDGQYAVKVVSGQYGGKLISARHCTCGEVIYAEAAAGVREVPTSHTTIERRAGEHWEFFGPLRYTNHSFEPNAAVEFQEEHGARVVRLVGLVSIVPGDEITFDYETTESSMVSHCTGVIENSASFSHRQFRMVLSSHRALCLSSHNPALLQVSQFVDAATGRRVTGKQDNP